MAVARSGNVAYTICTSSTRPTNPSNGNLIFETDTSFFRFYNGTAWIATNTTFNTTNLANVFGNRTTFSFTGSNQNWVVPGGVTYAYVKLWGGGGAGGTLGGWAYGSYGGGGGFAGGLIPVTAAETLIFVVGGAGLINQAAGAGYGGGMSGARDADDNRYGGGGGGYSGIFRTSVTQGNAVIIAGGGGGGGSSRASYGNGGGGGGGVNGQHGFSPFDNKYAYGGRGGTQSAAGADASCDSAEGAGNQGALQGGWCRINCYGGGGGGGYWGGSAGGYSESNTMGGGGGGSGFLKNTTLFGQLMAGSAEKPGNSDDYDFLATGSGYSSIAYGGAPQGSGGGFGYAVVYY